VAIRNTIKDIFLKVYNLGVLKIVLQPLSFSFTEVMNDEPSTWEGDFDRYVEKKTSISDRYGSKTRFDEGTHDDTQSNLSGFIFLGYDT